MKGVGGRLGAGVLLALALGAGCERVQPPWFEEDAWRAGLTFEHVTGLETRWHLPEIMGGGVGLIDADGDGWLDVYFVQGGDLEYPARPGVRGNVLYRNHGGQRFEDVTARAGVGDVGYGMGCAVGDVDADGRSDLYVTNVGPNVLYRNVGEGRFGDATARARVAHAGWSAGAAFCDYDADGDLDLFVVSYLDWSSEREPRCEAPDARRDYCQPLRAGAPARDVLYRNEGDGTFTDVSEAAGLGASYGNGLGCVTGDLDDDGDLDLYVANDMMANQLWLQEAPGRFVDRALSSGCALSGTGFPESGMGLQAVDLEADGDLDLFLTHMRRQSNTLYARVGKLYEDSTAGAGLAASSVPFTGFGLGFADFDHDGHLDLYVANGRVAREAPFPARGDPYAEPDLLYSSDATGRFAQVSPAGGVRGVPPATGRGAALGDLDNDGDLDVVVCNRDARAYLLRNRAGESGSWIQLRLLDEEGVEQRGARVQLAADGLLQTRLADPNFGYLSSHDPRVHFGLGSAARAERVRVRWPDGEEELWSDLAAGRLHVLRRGTGQAGAAR